MADNEETNISAYRQELEKAAETVVEPIAIENPQTLKARIMGEISSFLQHGKKIVITKQMGDLGLMSEINNLIVKHDNAKKLERLHRLGDEDYVDPREDGDGFGSSLQR